MLKEFDKLKNNWTSPKLFLGTTRKSAKDPKARLVLFSKASSAPLKDTVRACLLLAKFKYQVLTLEPEEMEADETAEK